LYAISQTGARGQLCAEITAEEMNIIIVGTAYPLRGGLAHYNALLASHLGKCHNVDIITFKRQYPNFLFPGKSQQETGDAGIPLKSEQLIDSINPINWIRVGLQLRKRRPDVVIFKYWLPFFGPCFGTICRIIRWRQSTRIIAICDNVIPHERRPFDQMFTRYAFGAVDAFVVQSETVEQHLKSLVRSPSYKKVAHPVYENFGPVIAKTEARQRLGLIAEKIILFFGYIRQYKGLHTLIEAMKIVKESVNATLLVVGEFYDNEKNYREHIAREGLENHVRIVSEYVPNEKVAEYFSAADVVVLPYHSATQSGIAQIAYNFNVPVIATDVGGLKEVVIDGISGIIVPPENAQALGDAIITFYKQKLGERLSSGVQEEKKKYSWNTMVETIEELAHCKKNNSTNIG
jgi:glycosyltransferase involved in cell wall biosynthesis